jgi:monooxygenase
MEHLDVLIVGAGLSGIGAGHYLQADCPWASYAIFEARDSIGGTWDLFRYPGIRSDSDMFTLGYSFRPWDGEKSIADGHSILDYIKATAAAEGIDHKIRFNHKIVKADWSNDDAVWRVTAERTDTGETVELTAGFVYACAGYYRYDRGYQPEFPGIDEYAGQVVHPQFWPEDLDYEGKRVVVIGSGATAVTLIPSMADKTAHITMLQRSPSYIGSLPAKDPLANAVRRIFPSRLSGPAIRWYKALTTQAFYEFCQRRPAAAKKLIFRMIRRQLPKGYDVETHFTPRYNPWDQRFCLVPNGDLFRAISAGKASVVTDTIDTFTEKGIRVSSGQELEADIVVTATGLEVQLVGGVEATIDGQPIDVSNRLMYKGMMVEGVPNFAMAIGYTNASWTLKCDLTCQYVTRLLNHLHETGQRQCTAVNNDGATAVGPMLGLSSGYVTRAADRMPKQGSKFPWQVHQSYLRDYRALRMTGIEDDCMEFSNPVPEPALAAAAAD